VLKTTLSETSAREPEVLRRVSRGKSVCKSITGKGAQRR